MGVGLDSCCSEPPTPKCSERPTAHNSFAENTLFLRSVGRFDSPARPPWANASTSKVQQLWAALPTVGQIAVVAVPVLMLLEIIAAVAGVGSRDEASYQYGYQTLTPQLQPF